MRYLRSGLLAASVGLLTVAACGGDGQATAGQMAAGATGASTLVGAGATFPFPIYSRWFHEYQREHPVRVNYQSIGSGGGIRQFVEQTVDFGASDAPMSDEDLARVPGGGINLPTVLGSVAITYNLPELTQPLRLDGPTIAGIFLGEVRQWNDPQLAALNPGVSLPSRAILPVQRSDGSGTTYVFADYLANASPGWRHRVGVGTSLRWPTGIGGKGNEGVTGQVRQTQGAIGYVEQVYARQNNLPMAQIRNRAGEFVDPSIEAIRAAAGGLENQLQGERPDFRRSIVDSPVAGAYPISSFTYLLAYTHMADCQKARALVNVWEWALTEGDRYATELHYAPLPESIQQQVVAQLRSITCGSDRQPVGGSQ